MNPLVSIVIVNFNGRNLLESCMGSLASQTYKPLELIVADNASTDGSVEFLRERYPDTIVLDMGCNRGYAAAANAGIRRARGAFIATLNNDTRADDDWIQKVMEIFGSDPGIGSCASRQMDFYHPDIIDSTGIVMRRGGYPTNRGHGQRFGEAFARVSEVFGAPGATAVYSRAMLDRIGLFDEDYFAYQEEWDLSFRAVLAGWKCVYIPEAVVYHMGGVTMAKRDSRRHIFLMERNRIFTLIKNYPLELLRSNWPYLAKYELDILKRFLLRFETAPIAARFSALRYIPAMIRKRKEVRALRRIDNEALLRWIV